jgi:EAL domain-containing protein (putative c-di-GMP-specific phosphodiesterase class I)/ActR/RegA family two-component response regulator
MLATPSPQLEPAPAGTVLLVDDDALVLRAWARVLKKAGFVVETLGESSALAETLRRTSFEAVLTDVRMAGVDGFGVLRGVREQAPSVPVLLATGAAELSGAMRAVNDGAFRYLEKPIDPDQLVAAVGDAVRQHRIASAREEAFQRIGAAAAVPAAPDTDLRTRFDTALQKRWMAYQPIVDRRSGAVCACEALLRTAEPGFVRPPDLLAAAEQLDRVAEVGRAVRADVAAALAGADSGLAFVNLHPRELDDPELYRRDAPLSALASRVVLEITERASLATVSDVTDRVAALRALGYRIAVDDLGAGYAGLASFARLKPEVVKLDMSLVRGVDQDPLRQKLVSSIVRASQDLDILVVAEGIETEAERAAVEQLEVDLLQGYLLGRPQREFAAPGSGAR